jgi:hypothetical protein
VVVVRVVVVRVVVVCGWGGGGGAMSGDGRTEAMMQRGTMCVPPPPLRPHHCFTSLIPPRFFLTACTSRPTLPPHSSLGSSSLHRIAPRCFATPRFLPGPSWHFLPPALLIVSSSLHPRLALHVTSSHPHASPRCPSGSLPSFH